MTKRMKSLRRLLDRKFSSRISPSPDGCLVDDACSIRCLGQGDLSKRLRNPSFQTSSLGSLNFENNRGLIDSHTHPLPLHDVIVPDGYVTHPPHPLRDVIIETPDGYITTTQLYNILSVTPGHRGQNSGDVEERILIVDTRSLEEYKERHVTTAVHMSQLASTNLECYKIIILYDDTGSENPTSSDGSERVEDYSNAWVNVESFSNYSERVEDSLKCSSRLRDCENKEPAVSVDFPSCSTEIYSADYVFRITARDGRHLDDCFAVEETLPMGIISKEVPPDPIVIDDTNGYAGARDAQVTDEQFKLLVLIGGYDLFHSSHPYYCTDMIVYDLYSSFFLRYPSLIFDRRLDLKDYGSTTQGQVRLYLGSAEQATSSKVLSTLSITHIVNVTREINNAFEDHDVIQYLKIDVADENTENLLRHFRSATEFIVDQFSEGSNDIPKLNLAAANAAPNGIERNVLVHCDFGVSRSATVCIAFCMRFMRISLNDAFEFVKRRRSVVRPNCGFLNQLSRYEEMLFGRKYTTVEKLYDI